MVIYHGQMYEDEGLDTGNLLNTYSETAPVSEMILKIF